MIKKFFLFCICFLLSLPVQSEWVSLSDSFDADLCRHGKGGTWLGACACYTPEKFGGRYCDITPLQSCKTNNDCPQNSYCYVTAEAVEVCDAAGKNKKCLSTGETTGVCYETKAYGPVFVQNASFVLSDSILNKKQADNFCAALGNGWHTASRADFNCRSIGPGCLDLEILTPLKTTFRTRGFFWLEPETILNTNQNYYADLLDGTVYRTSAENHSTMQALCINKERK